MWIFDDVWMCHQKLLRGEFHGAPVLAGAATPREPCAAELGVALRGCAAAMCRKLGAARRAEVALLKWHKRFCTMFLTVPDAPAPRCFFGTAFYQTRFLFCAQGRIYGRCNFGLLASQAKGLGACLVERITGRSGLDDGIARCSGLNIGLFGRALAQLQNLEERQCC